VLSELGLHDDRLFKLAMALEKIAIEDDYFVQRKLYPNVDFYSGIVQRALGIPNSMFTCIFALARTVGWVAQWERDGRRPGAEDRAAATALYGSGQTRRDSHRQAARKTVKRTTGAAGSAEATLQPGQRPATIRQSRR